MTDNTAHLYKRRKNTLVTAVQLNLDTDGFSYRKWGSNQQCQAGDWLISSIDDCYTVARDSFLKTYRQVSPGRYEKHGSVRARQMQSDGTVSTREGQTDYQAGDYLVENSADESDTYAISKHKFHELYELIGNDS